MHPTFTLAGSCAGSVGTRLSTGFSPGTVGFGSAGAAAAAAAVRRTSSSGVSVAAAVAAGAAASGTSASGDYNALLSDDAHFLEWAQSPTGRAQIATELRR